MRIYLGRTTKLKSDFVHGDYAPDPTISTLNSVQVQLPQQSNTPIRQIGQRALAGNYMDLQHPATISMTWQTTFAEARRLFTTALGYFQRRAGYVMTLHQDSVPANQFGYLSGCSIQTQGLQPTAYQLDMVFLNCPDIYAKDFDPLEFAGVQLTESESVIKIEEDPLHDDLITSISESLSMRADFRWGLVGFRSLRFGEAMLAQSIQTIDADYIPTWNHDDRIELTTATEQFSSNIGDAGARQYSISRQAQLKPLESVQQIQLGW